MPSIPSAQRCLLVNQRGLLLDPILRRFLLLGSVSAPPLTDKPSDLQKSDPASSWPYYWEMCSFSKDPFTYEDKVGVSSKTTLRPPFLIAFTSQLSKGSGQNPENGYNLRISTVPCSSIIVSLHEVLACLLGASANEAITPHPAD